MIRIGCSRLAPCATNSAGRPESSRSCDSRSPRPGFRPPDLLEAARHKGLAAETRSAVSDPVDHHESENGGPSFLKERWLSKLCRPSGWLCWVSMAVARWSEFKSAHVGSGPRVADGWVGRSSRPSLGRVSAVRPALTAQLLEGPVSSLRTIVLEARKGFVGAPPSAHSGRGARCGQLLRGQPV